jgi:hypothetical protein
LNHLYLLDQVQNYHQYSLHQFFFLEEEEEEEVEEAEEPEQLLLVVMNQKLREGFQLQLLYVFE